MGYYAEALLVIQRFHQHLKQVEDFGKLSIKEQNVLRFALRTDSVDLETVLTEYQQHEQQSKPEVEHE